jgi:filamentous hemagglutinin family protein
MKAILHPSGRWCLAALLAQSVGPFVSPARANPVPVNPSKPFVQGSGSIPAVPPGGHTLTILQTSPTAQINWSSFNINAGETTTFVQPSSSSVAWNYISDPNPSSIAGNLNANGYIVLQNPSGFTIGGTASITTHGLVMTTSQIPVPNLTSGGAWDFKAMPPTAKIINYGSIQTDGKNGGSIFLIASADENSGGVPGAGIQNYGTISAPQAPDPGNPSSAGTIGLYAGKEVLVSTRPDGRGLTARVTLPQGSVDNEGKIIADAGTIEMHAQVVNQGGLVQANSIKQANGVIELIASDQLNVSKDSVITAQADSTANTSPGGFVVLDSDKTYSDNAGSKIIVSGKPADGFVQVFGNGITTADINSTIDGVSATQFSSGKSGSHLLVNTVDLTISSDPTGMEVDPSDPTFTLQAPNISVSDLAPYSKIALFALGDINFPSMNTVPNLFSGDGVWTLPGSSDPGACLTLRAGRNINLWDGSGIVAGQNWSLNFTAGTELTSAANISEGNDRIWLQGLAYIQGNNGDINLTAGNEIFVDDGTRDDSTSPFNSGVGNGITTMGGGSITATAIFGNINTGGNPLGYNFTQAAPYYSALTSAGALGGISTAAGGDVTLTAGGDIISYLPSKTLFDGGSGAFDPLHPGNVTISAGGSVFGHFVEADGTGSIYAGANAGGSDSAHTFALSLVKGSWNVNAPYGSIYLQEVRNPNGDINDLGGPNSPGYHLFDYDPTASVSLTAGNLVEITGRGLPRPPTGGPGVVLPPSLSIVSGTGGVIFDKDVYLFPSASGELSITTTGGMIGRQDANGVDPTLLMSDSGSQQWISGGSIPASTFGPSDHGNIPPELGNPNPVRITVMGDMDDLKVQMAKQTQIFVAGNMNNCGFSGENLHPGDVTSITVQGQMFTQNAYTFATLSSPIVAADGNNWDAVLWLAVNPADLAVPAGLTPAQLASYAHSIGLLGNLPPLNPDGFVYNPATLRFGFFGKMSTDLRNALEGPLQVILYGPDGTPLVQNGKLVTQTVSFVPASVIEDLYNRSQQVPNPNQKTGYYIAGPGQFNINAGSMDLGASDGIQSSGPNGPGYLTALTPPGSGASVNVDVAGNLGMFTSRIVSEYGGAVTVNSGGTIDLGSTELLGNTIAPAYGIWTSGKSDVTVIAQGNINIEGSRIAAYSGGNVFVESLAGSVFAGSGGNDYVLVPKIQINPTTGQAGTATAFIYGSGIVTASLESRFRGPGETGVPGDITVLTPQGDIVSDKAGVLQLAVGGALPPGPTITLVAGTAPTADDPTGHAGNIDLGESGVIGGTVSLQAQGNIKGLIISEQSATINAAQNFSGTLLSAGSANVSAGGSVSGNIVGIGSATVSGSSITANVQSANASVGGAQATSTFGTSSTATAASGSAAQTASSETRQQLAQNNPQDDDEKKKKGKGPVLTKRVGRVTVFLPKS